MSLDHDARIEMIRKHLDKSLQTWYEAEAARTLRMWPMTANRMYYALVNALRALLLLDGHPTHSHAGMKSAIGQYYVLTGIFTIEEARLFSQMETMREKADYDCYFDATETDVTEKYEPTRLLIDKIKQLVTSRLPEANHHTAP